MKRCSRLLAVFVMACLLLAGCQKKEQQAAATAAEKVWTITQFNALYDELQMFYTIIDTDGNLIVIDGGSRGNEEIVRRVIEGYGGKVKAWILTRPTPEHIEAFMSIYSEPDGIVVEKVYDAFIDRQRFGGYATRNECEVYDEYLKMIKDDSKIVHVYRDAEFTCNGLKFECFNAYDSYVEENAGDMSRDGSLLLKISGNKESFLVCSDIASDMETYILNEYGDKLDCDIVQMGNHGNNGFSIEFYKKVSPQTAFFDGRPELYNMEGLDVGLSYDDYRKAFEEDGVTVYDLTTAPNSVEMR